MTVVRRSADALTVRRAPIHLLPAAVATLIAVAVMAAASMAFMAHNKRAVAGGPPGSMCVTPPPAPALDPDPNVAKDQAFRRSVGLSDDPQLIRSLQAQMGEATNEAMLPYPVYLTPTEQSQMDLTQQLGRDTESPNVRSYLEAHADEFAGIYVGPATETSVVFLWTAHVADHQAALQALYPAQAGHVIGKLAVYSAHDLTTLSQDVNRDRSVLQSAGVTITGAAVDQKRNLVVISADPADGNALTVLRTRFATSSWCLRQGIQPVPA